MTNCACPYCGRRNEAGAQFCVDCGKPMTKAAALQAAARASVGAGERGPGAGAVPEAGEPAAGAACPLCGGEVQPGPPFCPHCGRRLTAPGSGPACARCYSPVATGAKYCATCGAPVDARGLTRLTTAREGECRLTLGLLDESGRVLDRFERATLETTIGRLAGDVRFPDDPALSPLHAKLSWEEAGLVVRDLGSRNGTWVLIEEPYRLVDGDRLLIGAQTIRFRRLGYPGPHAPEADATRRVGSLVPSADIASLTQVRADGSARDVIHLSPGRDVHVGRERGDWIFPYDPSMSAQHAMIRSEDADFVVVDLNSRNGVGVAVRGERALRHGSRLMVGDRVLRVEIPS